MYMQMGSEAFISKSVYARLCDCAFAYRSPSLRELLGVRKFCCEQAEILCVCVCVCERESRCICVHDKCQQTDAYAWFG